MSEPYDGPDFKPEVQADDKKPEEALVVPPEGVLEGDPANASAFARDILASVVDEVIRRSKTAPADDVYTRSSDKTSARGIVTNRPIDRETLNKTLKRELRLIDWDDPDSNDSFASIPENDQNTSLQNTTSHHSKSNDAKEKLGDLNADSKIGMICFSSLESLGGLKEFPSGAKMILDMFPRRPLETSRAKDTTPNGETKSVKEADNQNIKSERKQDNSLSETLNTIVPSSVDVLCSIEQTNDLTEENKPANTLLNEEKLIKTSLENDETKMISEESRENKEQIVESNSFQITDKEDITMKKSVSERGDITSKKGEVNGECLHVKKGVNLRQTRSGFEEEFVDAVENTGEIKGDITDIVSVTKEGDFTKAENTEIKEDVADTTEDNPHDEETPTTSDAKDETPENEQEATCETQAARTVHSAALHASDNVAEVRSPAPLTAKCPIERPAGGAEAAAESARTPSVAAGARGAPSPPPLPPPPPLVAELARHSPSAEQLRVALAKELTARTVRAGSSAEYDLFWSALGLLRRYEDPMRPTSSQAQAASAEAELAGKAGDSGDEDEGEQDEEVAAAIDAINALFPKADLDDDDDEEDDDVDDLDDVPPKHVVLQRDDDDEEENDAVHPTPSFRRVVSVHSHSAAASISKPLVPFLPTPAPLAAPPATVKEKKSFRKRLQKFFSHPFGSKKNKAKPTGNVSVP